MTKIKIGRNEPCPCGSGKKFKRCCSLHENSIEGINYNDISSIIIDHKNMRNIVVSKKIIENQLNRDGPKNAESFDNLFCDYIREISEEYARVLTLFNFEFMEINRESDEIHIACLALIFNSSSTIVSALDCLRHGYRLQPGILVRHAIESICTVIHLYANSEDLQKYNLGNFSSTKAISSAKKVIPIIGGVYGFFSREFAHIGTLQRKLSPIGIYKEKDDEAVLANLRFIKFAINLLYISTELIFFDNIPSHRYWEKIKPGIFAYKPSVEERKWQEKFLMMSVYDEG
jgi:hypothetical protein